MAPLTCPKCENHKFEVNSKKLSNYPFKLLFVQCSNCGTVVGVKDEKNIGEMLQQQNDAIKKIAAALNVKLEL